MSAQLDGIDVSHYQDKTGDLSPYGFAAAKATEGAGFKDPEFGAWWQAFKNAGIARRAAYHFLRNGDAGAQIDNLIEALAPFGGLQVGECIMLDWERAADGSFPNMTVVDEWMTLARQEWPGRELVYSAPWVRGFSTWINTPNHDPLFLADYSANGLAHASGLGAIVLQYTSTAHVPGIPGNVDGDDVLDWSTLNALCGLSGDGETVIPAPGPDATNTTDTLPMYGTMNPNDVLVSNNGNWVLQMQGDGNLVVSVWTVPKWNSHTNGNTGAVLRMQGDGNLVIQAAGNTGKVLWNSGAIGRHINDSHLVMQDDGNAVVYSGTDALWSTKYGHAK